MGAKRGGDALGYWERFELLKGDLQDKQIITDAQINSSSTLSMWKNRRVFPAADVAVRIAGALKTTVEYMVSGIRPVYLSLMEVGLLDRARKWEPILEDLEVLDPAIAESWQAGIHAAAQTAKPQKSEIAYSLEPSVEDLQVAEQGKDPLGHKERLRRPGSELRDEKLKK
jgi:transcriptional regulator with XRE-family HTH domain